MKAESVPPWRDHVSPSCLSSSDTALPELVLPPCPLSASFVSVVAQPFARHLVPSSPGQAAQAQSFTISLSWEQLTFRGCGGLYLGSSGCWGNVLLVHRKAHPSWRQALPFPFITFGGTCLSCPTLLGTCDEMRGGSDGARSG